MKSVVVETERLQEVDAIRLIANYLVVVIHSVCVFQWVKCVGLQAEFWKYLSQVLAPMAMPTLFFLSGYVFFLNSSNSYTEKIRKRVGRLFIPYVCWNLIFIIGFLVLCLLGIRKWQEPSNLIMLLFWVRSRIFSLTAAPADMPTWFIRALFVYVVLLSPFIKIILLGKHRLIRIAISFFIIALFNQIVICLDLESKIIYTYPVYSVASFFIGSALSIYKIELSHFWRGWWFLYMILGIACLVLSHLNFIPRSFQSFLQVGQILVLISVGGKLSLFVKRFLPNIFSDASFFVYLSHIAILPLVARIGVLVFNKMPLACSLIMLFSIFFSIYICLFAYMVLERFLPRVAAILNGRFRL